MNLTLGFSPCPNDTFLFDALVHGRIDRQDYAFTPVLDDVEALNKMAFEGKLDITKLSYHAFAYLTDHYQMLPSGSALGKGVGPLLITKGAAPATPRSEWLVAVPGKFTTANLLLSLAYPEIMNRKYMLFSDIEEAVLSGQVDAGVIIHENRFTYFEKDLVKQADLGEFWEMETGLPIPLGGIAVRRDLPVPVKRSIAKLVRESTEYAFRNPEHSLPFVQQNAQEMDPEVMQKHIALYVNPFTVDLGESGIMAVESMLKRLLDQGLIKNITTPWLVG